MDTENQRVRENLVFNHRFFQHVYDYKKQESGGRSLKILIGLYQNKAFCFVIFLFEKTLGFVLGLPVPIYSDLVLILVTNLPGLPRMLGCYVRGIYYKSKITSMAPNVIIEQGAIISHPENVELSEFALIDKYVILAANKVKIGRRVHLAPFVMITGGGEFIIEDYACMATGSRAVTATESLKPGTRSSGPMVPYEQRDVINGLVHIKKDAFVAVGATILTNTTVEQGVVITSGVVCSGATEDWKYYVTKDGSNKPVRSRVVMGRKELDLPEV